MKHTDHKDHQLDHEKIKGIIGLILLGIIALGVLIYFYFYGTLAPPIDRPWLK